MDCIRYYRLPRWSDARLLPTTELLNDNNFANPLSRKDNRVSQPWAAPDFSESPCAG